MNSIETRVFDWATNRGLDQKEGSGHLLKLVEEVGELAGCHVKQKPDEDLFAEAADVFICLLMYSQARGIDLFAEAHKKMEVNEQRAGKVNKYGVYVKVSDMPLTEDMI